MKKRYRFIGNGWCRPSAGRNYGVNAYSKGTSENDESCRSQCDGERNCFGYAISTDDHSDFPGTCYIYVSQGTQIPSGWEAFTNPHYDIASASGDFDVSCFMKKHLCKAWCANRTPDWITKCEWDHCGGCDECGNGVDTTTTTTTCPQWCHRAAERKTWATVCNWDGCKSVCSQQCEATTTTTTTTTTAVCPTWCVRNERPDDVKCNWEACENCSFCST